jgi:hypothetical protein
MLFCLTVNYTPRALDAMAKTPNTNRREAVEKLLTAAGGKLVAMYALLPRVPVRWRSLILTPLRHRQWSALPRHPMAFTTSRCSACSLEKK